MARQSIIQQSPHAFSFVSAKSAQSVLQICNATGLPTVALDLPLDTPSVHSSVRELVALRDSLPHTIDMPGVNTQEQQMNACSFLVKIDPCRGSLGLARLQAYTALMLGSAGVLHTSTVCSGTGEAERTSAVAEVNSNLAQWAPVLDPFSARMRLTSLTQASNTSTPWPVPVDVARGSVGGAGSLITSLSSDVLVASFLPVGMDGQVNTSKAPPLLLLLDARTEGAARNVTVTLAQNVVGWSARSLCLALSLQMNSQQGLVVRIYSGAQVAVRK